MEHVEEHVDSRKNGGHSALDLPFFVVSASYRLCHVAESTVSHSENGAFH